MGKSSFVLPNGRVLNENTAHGCSSAESPKGER